MRKLPHAAYKGASVLELATADFYPAMKLSAVIILVLFYLEFGAATVSNKKHEKIEKGEISNGGLTAEMQATAEQNGEFYNNKVIYIESNNNLGYYGEALNEDGFQFKEVDQDGIVNDLAAKWLVLHMGSGKVLLQSMKYQYNFLQANSFTNDHGSFANHTYMNYPFYGEDNTFYIISYSSGIYMFNRKSSNLVVCCGYSARMDYKTYADSYFRIYIPTATMSFEPLATYINSWNTPIQETFEQTVGISRTEGKSSTEAVAASVGHDINETFTALTYGNESSYEWPSFSQITYSEAVIHLVTVNLPGNTRMIVKQLVGQFADWNIYSQHVVITN